MHTSHRIAITAGQLQLPATTSGKSCAAGQRWLRQAAAQNEGRMHPTNGASIVTAPAATRETAKHLAASCITERVGTKWPGRAAAWHVVPNSPPLCISCFAAHARGRSRTAGWLARPGGCTAPASSPFQTPQASSTKARPNARFGRAVPNRSVKASPNSWPGLPCLGQRCYRPSQFMPGQLSAPPYLQR